MEGFCGVWKRTSLFEPKASLTPHVDSEMIVIWIQSSCGLFIDIRVPPNQSASATSILRTKSFAGHADYKPDQALLTWTREIDFRYPSQPDQGYIKWISENKIEEINVDDSDDYLEIWDRFECLPGANDVNLIEFAARGVHGVTRRPGFLIVTKGYFAFSCGRENDDELNSKVQQYFQAPESSLLSPSSSDDSSSTLSYITDHLTVVGQCSDWKVQYSTEPLYIGYQLNDGGLGRIYRQFMWNEVLCGKFPDALACF